MKSHLHRIRCDNAKTFRLHQIVELLVWNEVIPDRINTDHHGHNNQEGNASNEKPPADSCERFGFLLAQGMYSLPGSSLILTSSRMLSRIFATFISAHHESAMKTKGRVIAR